MPARGQGWTIIATHKRRTRIRGRAGRRSSGASPRNRKRSTPSTTYVCSAFSLHVSRGAQFGCHVPGEPSKVHVCEDGDLKASRCGWHKRTLQPSWMLVFFPTFSPQDIRDLVLHLAADAPPPSWVRVEVSPSFASVNEFSQPYPRTLAP